MKNKSTASLVILIATLISADFSMGAITVYTDRISFESALLSIPTMTQRLDENFDSYVADSEFHSQSLDMNGFVVSTFGNSDVTRYLIDAPPLTAKQSVNNTSYLSGNHQGSTRGYQFVFNNAVIAWSGDYSDTESSTTDLLLSGGVPLALNTTGASNIGFIGFISDTPVTSITSVGGSTGDQVGWDNITTIVSVPEPSTIAFASLATCGLVINRRRSRSQNKSCEATGDNASS